MITTKGRYALIVMLDLAEQKPEEFVPLKEIATRQGLSKKYLEIVLKVLVQNELLKCAMGKGGGYRLTRKPAEYTVGEILELAEGTLSEVPCLQSENNPCEKKFQCRTLPIWEKFNKLKHDFFYSVTLKDLLEN